MDVTAAMIRRAGAPRALRRRFDAVFGEHVTIEREWSVDYPHDFDWTWCGHHLLAGKGPAVFQRQTRDARNRFMRQSSPFAREYDRVIEHAYADMIKISDSAMADHHADRTEGWSDYPAVKAHAIADYESTKQAARRRYLDATTDARHAYVQVAGRQFSICAYRFGFILDHTGSNCATVNPLVTNNQPHQR